MSVGPISFQEMESWARLMRIDPHPSEIQILVELDQVRLNVFHEYHDPDFLNRQPISSEEHDELVATKQRFDAAVEAKIAENRRKAEERKRKETISRG